MWGLTGGLGWGSVGREGPSCDLGGVCGSSGGQVEVWAGGSTLQEGSTWESMVLSGGPGALLWRWAIA